MGNAVIVLKSDPTLGRCLDSELTFWKDFLPKGTQIFIYSKSKSRIAKSLSDLFPLIDEINADDLIMTDLGDQNFFAGVVTKSQYENYKLFSDHTWGGGLVYFRVPDSEMSYVDLKQFLIYRKGLGKFESYTSKSIYAQMLHDTDFIDYSNIRFVKNGIPTFNKWNIKQSNLFATIDEQFEDKISIYPGDNLIFKVRETDNEMQMTFNRNPIHRFIHIGFFKAIGGKKEKLFEKFNLPMVDLYAFGAKSQEMKCQVINISKPFIGKSFYELLNRYLAYVFFGKGDRKSQLTYVNKTIYDCYVAQIPILIYLPIDSDRKVFADLDCYFETEEDLIRLENDLLDEKTRINLVIEQGNIINNFLDYGNTEN